MTGDMDSVRVTAKVRSILKDPSDGAPNLVGHRHEIAIGREDVCEMNVGEVRTVAPDISL